MTGGAGAGYIDGGCGPDDTVAAVYEGSLDTTSTGFAGMGSVGGAAARVGGAAAGPIPGPIAFESCL
jgi:hypothetical protein